MMSRMLIEAVRVMDDDGLQWLRLVVTEEGDFVWYKPTDFGFLVTSDYEAENLEAQYKKTLS